MNPRTASILLGALLLTLLPRFSQAYPTVEGKPVRYVIVTADALAPSFQPLADWKTRTGMPAVVRRMSDVIAAHPIAYDDAERVRLEIRDAWTAGAQWVLLGGGIGVVPHRYARTTFYGGKDVLTDLYFQCLDGDWDADGDHIYGEGYWSPTDPGDNADLVPEVWLGRAPVATPAEAQRFVAKTLQYERTPAGDYEHLSLECAEVLFPMDWLPGEPLSLDGADLVEPLLAGFDLHPSVHVARLYENFTDPRWRPGALPETRAAVLDSLRRGSNQTLIVGHGYIHTLQVGTGSLDEGDFTALTNGNRLSSFRVLGGTVAEFDSGGIGMAALLAPAGGAASVIGGSDYEFPTSGRVLMSEYYRLMYQDSVSAVGEANARSATPLVPSSTFDGVNRWTVMTQILLGDPELRTWTGPLRTLSVMRPPLAMVGDVSFDVVVFAGPTPVRNARVAAWGAGQFLEIGATDASGIVHLPIHPTAIGEFLLTVTAYDARPYEATVPIVERATPTLAALVGLEARPDRVIVRGQTSDGGSAAFALDRVRDPGAWTAIADVRADGSGHIRYEDLDVEPGATYRYRLASTETGAQTYSPALEVTLPARAALALRLRGPQPVTGVPEFEVTLPSTSQARLELVDVTGRRLATQEISGLGAGTHTVRLDEAPALAPGLYWLRLTQDGRSARSRMIVAR